MARLLAQVRPDERRLVAVASATLGGILAGHTLLETARDALFLARLPATRLAWMYVAVAVAALALTAVQHRGRAARIDRVGLAVWLGIAAAVDVAFWALSPAGGAWLLYTLYVWSGVFATLVVTRFWLIVGGLFTVGQAKRVYALVGTGSVLGSIAGSVLAGLIARIGLPRHLLLGSAAILAATGGLALGLLPAPPGDGGDGHSEENWRDAVTRPLQLVRARPYLRRTAAIVLVSTVALTLVDYLFKSAVARHVPASRLGSFFATATLGFNVLSLLAQVLLVGPLVRALGVDRVLSVLPALLAAGAAGVAAVGGFVATFVLKAVDGGLRYSLHRTATEVLFVPLPAEVRGRVKEFVDAVGTRGGQALASAFILTLAALPHGDRVLAGIVVALGAAWIGLARTLRVHYLDLFRETLSEVAVRTRFEFPSLDLASLETLLLGLNSPNDAEVLASLDLLAEQERVRLVPALVLYHPSPRVVVRALELFTAAGRDDFVPITERLLEHPDAEVRAATLRARAWIAPSAELYSRFTDDPSPIVRATALVGLVSYGDAEAAAARAAMQTMARTGALGEKLALARAISSSPGAGYEGVLLDLAAASDSGVRLEVARAMHEIRAKGFIPALIAMLPQQALRTQARETLVAIGPDALSALDAALGDRTLDRRVRRQLPRVIGQFGAERSASILERHLRDEPEGAVRYRILRTLDRMRDDDPTARFDRVVLEVALDGTLRGLFQLVAWKAELAEGSRADPRRRTAVQELVRALLEHKELQAIERLFLVLGLLHPDEDLRRVLRGLRSDRRALRASSFELLENLLAPPRRGPVLALVDDVPDRERLARAGPFAVPASADYESLLRDLLGRGGLGMRCLVVYHVGELRLQGLRAALETLPIDPGRLLAPLVERALARLASPASEVTGDGG